jgi:hypothetical protein
VQSLLASAKERGIYFKPYSEADEAEVPPAVAKAVEETTRRLSGVRGVTSVLPGRNEKGRPVVLVMANRGFSEAAFERVPEEVNGVPTLLVLPYELLPLRRER